METLRTILQPLAPLTHSLPTPLQNLGTSLLGPACYSILILDLNPTHTPCLTLAVSKTLSLTIIALSSIVKIPQLLTLLQARSAQGLSFTSYLLETAAFLVTLGYNIRAGFPFSTYGETALIAMQDAAIAVLVLHYGGGRGGDAGAAVLVAGLAGGMWALLDEGVVGGRELGWAQAGAGVLGVVSKAPQIWENWRMGGTGVLSAFAVFSYLAGSLSRIFTTLQEVDDPLILYGFVAGFALNAVLAAQMIYYWNSSSTSKGSVQEKKMKKKKKMGKMADSGAKGDAVATSTSAARPKTPSTRRRG
ncbi:hypothetical protein MMC20_006608 [Loxospora ochrophaea]|nr:hypothetical protein [Loxospora ochrophaea]